MYVSIVCMYVSIVCMYVCMNVCMYVYVDTVDLIEYVCTRCTQRMLSNPAAIYFLGTAKQVYPVRMFYFPHGFIYVVSR